MKNVFRYFAGFVRAQENWLNKMSAKGWRLMRAGISTYGFEPCNPSEYEYRVEFVAHKGYAEILDYKTFLEEVGYRVYHKNINLNYSAGKVTWRPGTPKSAAIASTPGAYNKELLIIERKADEKPFELHTSLDDRKSLLKTVRKMCVSYGLVMAALSIGLVFANLIAGVLALTIFTVICGALAIRYTKMIAEIEKEQITRE